MPAVFLQCCLNVIFQISNKNLAQIKRVIFHRKKKHIHTYWPSLSRLFMKPSTNHVINTTSQTGGITSRCKLWLRRWDEVLVYLDTSNCSKETRSPFKDRWGRQSAVAQTEFSHQSLRQQHFCERIFLCNRQQGIKEKRNNDSSDSIWKLFC